MSKTTYLRRKDNNECSKCGKAIEPERLGKTMCAECTTKNTIYKAENTAFYREHGLCPRCGKNKLYGSEVNCPECRAKNANNSHYTKEGYQKYNARRRDLRKERKAQGICVKCGKTKALANMTLCNECRTKRYIYFKGYRTKKKTDSKQDIWRKQGLCYKCGEPLFKHYKVCEKHYNQLCDMAHCENAVKARKELIENGRF